jgi:hypothetical protein
MAPIDNIVRSSTSLLERYYRYIAKTAAFHGAAATVEYFEPPMRLPELDAKVTEFLAPARAALYELGDHGGLPIRVLDLRSNPGTQTTKTFASRVIVARAIRYIQDTGRQLILFSPSSGNKAVALRDAVAGALAAGLVAPDQLRVVTLTPAQTVSKLRRSVLSEDPKLRALNPVLVLQGGPPESVKQVGNEFQRMFRQAVTSELRLWHSLRLENYQSGDLVRAFFDYEFGHASREDLRTVHAHAVSSAYGLLGYSRGVEMLKDHGYRVSKPQFLLVQHMATCDMVLHMLHDTFDRANIPKYAQDRDGTWVQSASAHFPARISSPEETLEHTFYTHRPATAPEMTGLIRRDGGTGIVVSMLECLQHYNKTRELLAKTPIDIPEQPQRLNEWSLVMAMTGVLNAIDRKLIRNADGVTIHASGTYTHDDYATIPDEWLNYVTTPQQVLDEVLAGGSLQTA